MSNPTKIRIYELAKELGVPNKDILEMLEKDFGVAVKSHSSSIESDLADKVKAAVKGGKKASAEKPAVKAAEKSSAEPEKVKAAQKPTPPKAPEPVVEKPVDEPPKAKKDPSLSPEVRKPEPVKSQAPSASAPRPQQPAASTSPKAPVAVQEVAPPKTAVAQQEAPKPAREMPQKHSAAASVEAPRPKSQEKSSPADEEETPRIKVKIEEPLSIVELAQLLKKRETELIKHLFMKGVMVTVNQTMQVEDAMALAEEMGFEAEGPDKKAVMDQFSAPEIQVRQTKGKHLKPRAPVVSIMGHVDHGKTSLLDAIRESRHKIVDSEAGGITQSIGAYTVETNGHNIVFIDTPGHEAFTAMRMRGAQATDIAILVVAADDGVMPQTIEAINHAKAASIPIIVAVNKIDKADAEPDKVMIQLSEYGLNAEKWGGDTPMVEVSALQKLGLDDLLEMITLIAELQELKADPSMPAEGVVIEAHLDKGKGAVATVLVQNGTLTVGEYILLSNMGGRVRALINDSGERVKSAGPSTPVEILGLNEVPLAGDRFEEIRNDKEFKRLLQQRQNQDREQRLSKMAAPGLMNFRENGQKDFNVIVKADTQGSVEAIMASILDLATEEVSVKVIHAATGDVSEADVLLASASNALIVAFNVREEANAQKAAQDQGIRVRPYDVIYHLTEDIEKMMLGLLSPETEEQEIGVAEVRQLFTFGKTFIAGCYVNEGKVVRNSQCRVFRNGKELYKGPLNNLKRFKEDAKEVAAGYECGISFDRFNDLQEGDIIRVFQLKEIERTSL